MGEGFRVETRGGEKREETHPSPSTESKIRSLFNIMFDYTLEYEIVPMNYARTFEISGDAIVEIKKNGKGHFPFIGDETKVLWQNIDSVEFADWVFTQCCMG